MEQDKQQRRVKVTGDAAHHAGVKRAAVKPHKRTSETSVKQVISAYVSSLGAGSLTQSYWGDSLARNAAALRSAFGLAGTDELYLLCDPTATGRAGMLLAASGVHMADGRGGTATITWKELPSCGVSYQRNMLVVGQSGIATRDGQALAGLLQQVAAKAAV